MVQHFHTQIEINRSPEAVRKIFLDFPSMPEWHKGFTITRLSPERPVVEPGDKIKIVADGTTLIPVIVENTSQKFQWKGSFYGLLMGRHTFSFEPSKTTPGGTTFVQDEEFTGILSILFYEGSAMREKTQSNFETYNSDIKARVESQS